MSKITGLRIPQLAEFWRWTYRLSQQTAFNVMLLQLHTPSETMSINAWISNSRNKEVFCYSQTTTIMTSSAPLWSNWRNSAWVSVASFPFPRSIGKEQSKSVEKMWGRNGVADSPMYVYCTCNIAKLFCVQKASHKDITPSCFLASTR